jgi:thermostable 8-oxoguanine DNA glycosylase
MIVHISVALSKENGKWVAQWQPQACVGTAFKCNDCTDINREILANRREELERKLDKALRLAFPKANYIIQHRK